MLIEFSQIAKRKSYFECEETVKESDLGKLNYNEFNGIEEIKLGVVQPAPVYPQYNNEIIGNAHEDDKRPAPPKQEITTPILVDPNKDPEIIDPYVGKPKSNIKGSGGCKCYLL